MPDSCREQILERAFAQQNTSSVPTTQKAGAKSFHSVVRDKPKVEEKSYWRLADWRVGIALLTAMVIAAVGSMMLLGVRNPAMQPPSEGLVMEAFSDDAVDGALQEAEALESAEAEQRAQEESQSLKNDVAKSRQEDTMTDTGGLYTVTEYQVGEAFLEDSGLTYSVDEVSTLSLDQTILIEQGYDPVDFYAEALQQELWGNHLDHVFLAVQMTVTYSAVSDDQPEEILPQLRFDVQPPLQDDICSIVYLDHHAADYTDLSSYCQMEKTLVLEESLAFTLGIVLPREMLGNQQIFLLHYNEYGEADGKVDLNGAYQKQAILKKALEPYRNLGKLSGEIVASIDSVQSSVSFAVDMKAQQYSSLCQYEDAAESPVRQIQIYTYDNQGECDEVTEHYDESGNLENTEHFHDPKENRGTFPKSQYESWVNGSVGFLPTAEITACLENMDNWEIVGVWQADGRSVVQIAGAAPENRYDILQFSMTLDVATGVCMEFSGFDDMGEGISVIGQDFKWESEANAPMQFDIAMFPDVTVDGE